ncbi:MAG: MFS transporter [Sandaracinaceae bacterium]
MAWLDPDRPFRPASVPFFYGWVIAGAATLGIAASIPGQTMGVSVFTDPLLGATGLSRLSLSNAYLVGTVCSGLLLPRGGTLLDRWGARGTAFFACSLLGVTLLLLSAVDGIIEHTHASLAFAITAALFFTLRFSGQGMLTLTSRTMVGKWFDRRRGLVTGLSGVFVAFAFAYAPVVLNEAIDAFTWRGAWRMMALVSGLSMGLVALLLFRDTPEACGLRMDGAPADEGQATAEKHAPRAEFTRSEALRTRGFWAVTAALSSQALVITGVTFHIVDIGAQAGLDEDAAVAVFLPIAVVSTVAGLLGGWAADRLPIKWMLVFMMSAQALGVVGATGLSTTPGYGAFVVGLGLSGGLFAPISLVALPRFFGRTHLGAISGTVSMCLVIGSAIGPTLLAASEDRLQSYRPALLAALALPALASLLAVLSSEPKLVRSE